MEKVEETDIVKFEKCLAEKIQINFYIFKCLVKNGQLK